MGLRMYKINRISALMAGLVLVIASNSFGMGNEKFRPFIPKLIDHAGVPNTSFNSEKELLGCPYYLGELRVFCSYATRPEDSWTVLSDKITNSTVWSEFSSLKWTRTRTIKLYRPSSQTRSLITSYETQTLRYTDIYIKNFCIDGFYSIQYNKQLSLLGNLYYSLVAK